MLLPPDAVLFTFDPPNFSMAGYQQCMRDDNPVYQMQKESAARAEQERLEHEQEAELLEQEDRDYQRAIEESRALLRSPTTSIASSSQDNSAQVPTQVVISGVPVTRVTPANWPTITTQMNATWMRDFEDRTKHPQAPTGRGQIDMEMIQKFRIIWWDSDDNDPVIFTVQECRTWPKWKLDDAPTTSSHLGHGPFQFYDINHRIWIKFLSSYPHPVKTDGYLLLHCSGVKCHQFDAHLLTAIWKPQNQCLYMSDVWQTLKTHKTKEKGKARAASPSSSEGEVEIVGTAGPSRREIKQEPGRSPSPAKQPHLALLVIPVSPAGASLRNPIPISDSPCLSPPSTMSTINSSASFFPPSACSSHSAIPSLLFLLSFPLPPLPTSLSVPSMVLPFPSIPGHAGPWLKNMYVCDMVDSFVRMTQLKKAGAGVYEDHFCQVYNQPPLKDNIYHDQGRRWKHTSEELQDEAYGAGRTDAGKWSRFTRCRTQLQT